MLDSNQLEYELIRRNFTLNVDNTHARGFLSPDAQQLVYVKTSRNRKHDPLLPVFKQPLVLHWSVEKTINFPQLIKLVPATVGYCNHNMRGFEGEEGKKPYGIAVAIESGKVLDEILNLINIIPIRRGSAFEDIEQEMSELKKLSETTRKTIIDARLGQGKFRADLQAYWKGCAVTGCAAYKMLRASHIKPWRDSSNSERLDPHNGLLLTANLDLAFDQGLISFDDLGNILIKKVLSNEDLSNLGIRPEMKLRGIEAEHKFFLTEHRSMNHFKK